MFALFITNDIGFVVFPCLLALSSSVIYFTYFELSVSLWYFKVLNRSVESIAMLV